MAHFGSDYFGGDLQVNNVVFFEIGTLVECLNCPNYIARQENPYAKGTTIMQVKIGQEYRRQFKLEEVRKSIIMTIENIFEFWRIPFDKDLARRYVRHTVPDTNEAPFCVPSGLYQITEVKTYLRGQRLQCKTYKPSETRPEHTLAFYQGIHHAVTIESLKVITDPENFKG